MIDRDRFLFWLFSECVREVVREERSRVFVSVGERERANRDFFERVLERFFGSALRFFDPEVVVLFVFEKILGE